MFLYASVSEQMLLASLYKLRKVLAFEWPHKWHLDRVKRIWYLWPMRAAKVQASLRIRAVSPEPSLLAHTSSESRGTFRQNARSLAPLNGWASVVKICHEGMLEDTHSLDRAHLGSKPGRVHYSSDDKREPYFTRNQFHYNLAKQ